MEGTPIRTSGGRGLWLGYLVECRVVSGRGQFMHSAPHGLIGAFSCIIYSTVLPLSVPHFFYIFVGLACALMSSSICLFWAHIHINFGCLLLFFTIHGHALIYLFIYLSSPLCFHLCSLMVYLSDWFLCPPTFSPIIHYLCTTPHRGAVAHYVVQTALFTGFGHVHAGIIRFSASPYS